MESYANEVDEYFDCLINLLAQRIECGTNERLLFLYKDVVLNKVHLMFELDRIETFSLKNFMMEPEETNIYNIIVEQVECTIESTMSLYDVDLVPIGEDECKRNLLRVIIIIGNEIVHTEEGEYDSHAEPYDDTPGVPWLDDSDQYDIYPEGSGFFDE